jgi:hypothetical protein
MTKKLRGSYHVDGRRSLTLSTEADDKLVDVGFRLVHDGSECRYRGNRWFAGPRYAQLPHSDRSIPALSGLYLGFRLVREDV